MIDLTDKEPTRQEKAAKLRDELNGLRNEAKGCLQFDAYERTRVLLNKCKELEETIADLERFKTDEEKRLFLIRIMENGYR